MTAPSSTEQMAPAAPRGQTSSTGPTGQTIAMQAPDLLQRHPEADAALLSADNAHRFVQDTGTAALLAAAAIGRAQSPTTGPDPADLQESVSGVDLGAPLGSTEAALAEASSLYLDDAVYFHHPRYAAHLNCPVALPAVAAEALVTSINTSMDTWDQSAGATLIERRLVRWAADLVGWGTAADGIFTSGGTQSNLQALLMARNRAIAPGTGPLPARLTGWRIYASQDSHFSIVRSAVHLGLGEDAVVPIPVDRNRRMDQVALERAMSADAARGLRALAVVATAGTTDFGAIDPLDALAATARRNGAWFHVDAAYGCGLLASPTRRHWLAGIERADSVTVDFHKSFFQPIGSSALLVAEGSRFAHITHHADYLNPDQDPDSPNQVDKSLQTTRRFDALKLWVTLRSLGSDVLGGLFDATLELAAEAGRLVQETDELELAAPVQLGTVVFRFAPAQSSGADDSAVDRLQDALRRSLYRSGEAMVAATTVAGRRHLKLTLLNPRTTVADVQAILEAVVRHGRAVDGTEVTA
ncbi:aspartate aminotransferase family protein [Citricoccus sp.]|uniref:pyridoxal phosphate-dependent decarboxylase family protein n=1 Tax=Citricoccus sp. TaxID=1978372 RepID=UPI0028BD8123|nr:aspartate aminotransferase family protein [Citricoccus sp.]